MIWGWDAVPDHLNQHKNPEAWKGKDGEWKRWLKGLQAFRFEGLPKLVFARKGAGSYRYENSDGSLQWESYYRLRACKPWFDSTIHPLYLSRIQPWTRWAVYLNWPFFFHIHWFYRQKDVLEYPNTDTNHLNIFKYFEVSFGFKRDADGVSWLTMFLGGRTE